jgi:signal transduction histidine kinase
MSHPEFRGRGLGALRVSRSSKKVSDVVHLDYVDVRMVGKVAMMSDEESTSPRDTSGVGTVTGTPPEDGGGSAVERDPRQWRTWESILPTRRPPVVLSVALLVTMLVQALIDPVAFLINGGHEWPNPIPFTASVALLVLFCVAQAAALLLTTRWPVTAVVVTIVISLTAVYVLNAPVWVGSLQLAVVTALFLLATRSSAAVTLSLLVTVIVAHVGAFAVWSTQNGLTPGVAVGYVFAQSAGSSAALVAAAVLGLWWGRQTRRVALLRAQAEADRRDHEERLARAREAERARITQELHDVAGQHIAGLLSLTEAALTIADQYSPDALVLLTEARSEARFAAASLFSALSDLRATGQARATATPDLRDLEDLAEFWRKREVRVQLHASGPLESLPAVISTSAYRVAQEALTNVAKHAPGTTADIELHLRGD